MTDARSAAVPFIIGNVLIRNALVIGVFFLGWHASAIFEVRPHVSALYFACGVTFAVGVLLGWRYLPTVYLATLLAYVSSMDALNLEEVSFVAPLRQTLVYGLAGLSVRHLWVSPDFRLSLPVALRFLLTALAASLMSAALAIHMVPFAHLATEVRTEVFFSFWGGDFAGVMVTVPMLLMLHHWVQAKTHAGETRLSSAMPQTIVRDSALLSALAAAVALLVILIPHLVGSRVRVDVLTLLPILLAGLWRGALPAFLVAMLVSLLEVFIRPLLGIPAGLSIDLQLLIAMGVAVALLAGASHDDRQFEWQRASVDALTGLANHGYFVDRLELEIKRSARTGKPFALLYLDLDGFKAINDRLGHAAGDELLAKTARRLLSKVRQTDAVARIGGDEFTIIFSEVEQRKDVERLAQSLLEAVSSPLTLGAETVSVSVSIGIAHSPQDGGSAKVLMHAADQAMYRAKAAGKNRFAFGT